jgi:hypothetical protein
MTSDKSIAKGLIAKYAGGDRSDVLKRLEAAARAARADEQAEALKAVSLQRALVVENLKHLDPTNKVERLKMVQTVRTMDAVLKLLGSRTQA